MDTETTQSETVNITDPAVRLTVSVIFRSMRVRWRTYCLLVPLLGLTMTGVPVGMK